MPGPVGAVARGVGAALAIALPAALLAQIVDSAGGDGDPPVLVLALAPVVLASAWLGGWVVGRTGIPRAVALGAVAGVVAIGVVQALGVARRLVADEDVAWGAVPVLVGIGGLLAASGSALAARARVPDDAGR